MKILYLCRSINIGGIPNVLLRAAKGLKRRGHEVHLCAQNGVMASEFRDAGVRLHLTPPSPFNRPQLALLLHRERFDIVHADNSTAGTDALTAFQWMGLGVNQRHANQRPAFVVAVHGLFGPQVKCDPCLPRTDCVIVFDTSTIERLRALQGMANHPLKMVRRPVEARSCMIRAPLAPHFVFVSRLSKSKAVGAAASIDAVMEMQSLYPGLHLTIVGEGSQRKKLRARALQINAQAGREVVNLVGALKDPFPLMAGSTGVIGTAMVAMEALFHEIPVVAAGYQGYGIVTPDNLDEAIECNFGDAVLEPRPITKTLLLDGFKHVIAERDSPTERAALNLIAARLQREHSIDAVAEGFERIYRETIEARRCRNDDSQSSIASPPL